MALVVASLGLAFGGALVVVDVSTQTPTANGNLGFVGAFLGVLFLLVLLVDVALLMPCIRQPRRGAVTTAVVASVTLAGWVVGAVVAGRGTPWRWPS